MYENHTRERYVLCAFHWLFHCWEEISQTKNEQNSGNNKKLKINKCLLSVPCLFIYSRRHQLLGGGGRFCVPSYVVLLLHLVVGTPIDGIIFDFEEPIWYELSGSFNMKNVNCWLVAVPIRKFLLLLLILLSVNLEDWLLGFVSMYAMCANWFFSAHQSCMRINVSSLLFFTTQTETGLEKKPDLFTFALTSRKKNENSM